MKTLVLKWCKSCEFEIRARHTEGFKNRIPDLISRWELNKGAQIEFQRLTEGVRKNQNIVTEKLLKFIYVLNILICFNYIHDMLK